MEAPVQRGYEGPAGILLGLLVLLAAASFASRVQSAEPPLAPHPEARPPAVDVQPSEPRASDAPLREHAVPVVDYTLHASLDPSAHTVRGEGTIVWRNTSRSAVRELYLHLYLNAFKNDRSVFLRAPVGSGRGTAPVTDWGYV